MSTTARTFTVGDIVSTGGHGHRKWTFEVVHRTKCFVTLRDYHGDKTYRVGIKTADWHGGDGHEWVLPFGSFSQAPVVHA